MKQFFQLIILGYFIGILLKWSFPNLEELHSFVYGISISSFYQLVDGIGKKVVFPEFLTFSTITIWLVIPLIIFDFKLEKFTIPNLFGSDILAIDKSLYYSWAVPATLAMNFGLYLNKVNLKDITSQFVELEVHLRKISKNSPLLLFIVGASATFLGEFVPGPLRFVFFLFSQLTFIAVLYCVFGNFSYSKWVYFGTFFISLKNVASGGMFGELVWWGVILIFFILIKIKLSFLKKLVLISIGIFLISTIQSIKGEYRRLTWGKHDDQNSSINLLGKTAWNSISANNDKSAAIAMTLIYRVNHPYIVSRVMKYVPKKEPFANGETVFGSIFGAFVPRILWPNKPKSGGFENIRRFAQFTPHGSSAYDIGQIGDAWANFGFYGGILFLFIYGYFNSWILKKIMGLAKTYSPTLILWMPIIFLQLLKVEVSVETNFNAAIKGAFFIYLCFTLVKHTRYTL